MTLSVQIHRMGQTLRDISTWTWLTIFFFWLLFPPIVLLIKYFQLTSDMKAAGNAHKDQPLIDAADRLTLILILSLLGSVTGGITSIIGIILAIMLLEDMKHWAMARNVPYAADGFQTAKTAMILNIIPLIITQLIGMFMYPIGLSKAGNALSV